MKQWLSECLQAPICDRTCSLSRFFRKSTDFSDLKPPLSPNLYKNPWFSPQIILILSCGFEVWEQRWHRAKGKHISPHFYHYNFQQAGDRFQSGYIPRSGEMNYSPKMSEHSLEFFIAHCCMKAIVYDGCIACPNKSRKFSKNFPLCVVIATAVKRHKNGEYFAFTCKSTLTSRLT